MPTDDAVTIATGSGQEITGKPNVLINEHDGSAYVYIDDILAASYSDCDDPEEALEMMLEDYGVSPIRHFVGFWTDDTGWRRVEYFTLRETPIKDNAPGYNFIEEHESEEQAKEFVRNYPATKGIV